MSELDAERRLVELTRRELLRRGALGAGAACAGGLALGACGRVDAGDRPIRGVAVGPGWDKDDQAGDAEIGVTGRKHYVLSLLDLDAVGEGPRTIPLGFFGHGVIFDPLDPTRALVFEKKGPGACELDLAALTVTRPIETTRQFYGHGAFAPDGSLFYDTESVVEEDYRGVIVVRDPKTLLEIGEFPSFGTSPHDCRLVDDGKTLVITNGGARKPGGAAPSVIYVDVPSEKLIEELTFESADITAGHLTLSSKGDLAVSSSIRPWLPEESPAGVSFRPAGGSFRTMTEPTEVTSRMLGESLSIAIHEPTGVAGVTNPKGNIITFWDLAEGSFLRALDFAYPRGIHVTLDGGMFLVSYGLRGNLILVDPETLETRPESLVPSSFMTGSHLFLHGSEGLSRA